MGKRFAVGIDLGTSNSALAVKDLQSGESRVLEVPQLSLPGATVAKKLLPSSLYIPHAQEFAPGATRLPWSAEGELAESGIVGEFARERGALAPDRLVSSAKSWLSNRHVDRKSPILPWKSELQEAKISPFAASVAYLAHLRAAFVSEYRTQGIAEPIAESHVVLTVPASFDESARSLTHEAAMVAGWGEVTLLEEPQAALYSWLAARGEGWRSELQEGDVVLICDVGGGTADFSLVSVQERSGILELVRISVGEHILLGGDNMDLALAYSLLGSLEAEGHSLDQWQFLSLVHAAGRAKERLLGDEQMDEVPIAVASRGSSLFAKTISTRLSRDQAYQVLLGGFFPRTAPNEMPTERRSIGLQEWGLDYASDPALSKHLARFLARSLQNVRSDNELSALMSAAGIDVANAMLLLPNVVLFNGGVCKAKVIREQVSVLLGDWRGDAKLRELVAGDLDLAVARGASEYGAVSLNGKGVRIRAGTARSYYLGLESSTLAVPGYRPPVKGLCVVPQGMEEGTEVELQGNEFGLITGGPVEFRFFSSTVRAGDTVGSVVGNAERELEETSRLRVTLTRPKADDAPDQSASELLPVRLQSTLTELGMLELWMKHTHSPLRWKVEFNIRQEP